MKESYKPVILVLVSIGVYFTFIIPQFESLQEKIKQRDEYQMVVQNIEQLEKKNNELTVIYNGISQTEKDRLGRILPKTMDAVGLARELDLIASRHGASVTEVQIERPNNSNATTIDLPENKRLYESAIVSFKIVSNYPNFVKVLSDIERNMRIMDTRSIVFQTSESGIYEHKISVETYWIK